MKKLLMLLLVTYSINCYATNVNWGNITTTTCESGGDIIVPNITPVAPQLGYHFAGWRKKALRRIEYLESSGTQYIDTGFKPNNNSGMEIDFYTDRQKSTYPIAADEYPYLFGIYSASMTPDVAIILYSSSAYDSTKYWPINKSQLYGQGTGRYFVHINKRTASITASNGQTLSHTFIDEPYTMTNYTLHLFARNRENSILVSKNKIYSCKLYDNDILVHDFVPVLDTDNRPCMFDKVENKLYYNDAPSGDDFIAGSELDSEIGYDQTYISGDTLSNECDNVLGDIYFYPVFEPNVIDLNWKDRGNTIQTGQCTYGAIITQIPNDPIRPGYKFMGWRVKTGE